MSFVFAVASFCILAGMMLGIAAVIFGAVYVVLRTLGV